MERGNSVSRIAATAVLLALLGAGSRAQAGAQLMLIVSADSPIVQLDSLQIRKLFLGMTVTEHGTRLRPVLNQTDARVKEIFLQNIVSMSDSTYDRSILRLTLIQGQRQPTIYQDIALLLKAVASDPSAVSYAWSEDVAHDPRIKALRVLWHD